MREKKLFTFKTALGRSAAFHLVLFGLLLSNISFHALRPAEIKAKSPDPIQAVAISENDLKAEVSRLKKIDTDKKHIEMQEQQKLAEEKARLQQEREAEQQKLADLKKQQLEAQKALERENAKMKAAQALAEKQKQEKLAKDKAEKLKQDALAKAKADKLKQETLAKEKAANLAKQQAQAKAKADAEAAKLAAQEEAKRLALEQGQMREIEKYKLMVQRQIMRSWVIPGTPNSSDTTKLFVRLASSGTVLDVKITTSSGNPVLDKSAVAAVYKASPLPVPEDPHLFASFRELRLTLRPEGILSEG